MRRDFRIAMTSSGRPDHELRHSKHSWAAELCRHGERIVTIPIACRQSPRLQRLRQLAFRLGSTHNIEVGKTRHARAPRIGNGVRATPTPTRRPPSTSAN